MDSDRRSGYSQYYDNANVPTSGSRTPLAGGPPGAHSRVDSASRPGQYTPGRDSFRDSTYKNSGGGEDFAAQGWDVYSDFNNTGPRYATTKMNDGYQELPTPSVKSPLVPANANNVTHNPVELVTVPALGAEWKAEELHAMTKKGRNEDGKYARREKWKRWARDDYGCCGGWGTRRAIVWTLFGLCIVTGIILAFTIPRSPGITIDATLPLLNLTHVGDTGPKFGEFPASFLFNASLNLQVDTNSNYLPLKFNHLRAEVADLDTSRLIATGDLGPYTLPAKKWTNVLLPLNFNYTAANSSDITWAGVYNACRNKNQFPNNVRPGINLSIALYMDIAGLVTHPATSKTITNAPCPFELPSNAS